MARKMILIHEELLKPLYEENERGVPVNALIRKTDLKLSPPTVSKLIKMYRSYEQAVNEEVESIIYKALFPEWLTDQVQKQPLDYTFKGTFPLGTWEKC